MVVSDYTAIDQLPAKSKDPKARSIENAAAAINGGCDVDFPFGANFQYLQEAIDQGLVAPEVLERAVKNVLRYKYRAGLFDEKPYLYAKGDIKLDTPEERQTAYDIATQSIVLLQNDSNLLPLAPRSLPLKILLTGPNANTMWAMCGDYSFPSMTYFWKKVETDLDHPHVITLLEGMRDRLPEGDTLMYSRGCDWTEEIETKFSHVGDKRSWEYPLLHRKVESGEVADRDSALALADSADVIIAAVGENVMLCGENRDRQGLRLPGKQEEYVEALLATGKPVVLVVFGGRAQVISGLAERCAAVIQAWYPGEEGGHAVADILFGNVSPSAKLAVSYPSKEIYTPICYSYPLTSHSSPPKGTTKASLMGISKDSGSGRFLCEDDKINGYQVNVCGGLSDGDLYFGAWKNVIIGQWGGLQVKVDDVTGIKEGSVTIVAKLLADITITNPASFVRRVASAS